MTRTVDHGVARLMPDVDRARAWLLTVDGAPQSYVDLDEPGHLEFEYARRIGHAVDCAAPAGAALDVLHLGGGALSLPRYVAATRPGSRQDVVDADRGLVDLIAETLPTAPHEHITVHAADALDWLETAPAAGADLLIADVFGGSSVPAHLTTVAYAEAAARVLRPAGWYVANLADTAPFAFLGAQLATLGTVFDQLALIAEPAVLRGRRFGNAVVLASRRPLDTAELTRRCARDAFPARVVGEPADLRRVIGGARPVHDGEALASPLPPGGSFSIG